MAGRTTIGHLVAAVCGAALYCAAMLSPTEGRAEASYSGAVAFLLYASIRAGAGAEEPEERRWWFGFALFGWAHLLINGTREGVTGGAVLPTYRLTVAIATAFAPDRNGPARADPFDSYRLYTVANALVSLLVGFAGALALATAGRRSRVRGAHLVQGVARPRPATAQAPIPPPGPENP